MTANKFSAVYILSPAALDGLCRENRGSVNRLESDLLKTNKDITP